MRPISIRQKHKALDMHTELVTFSTFTNVFASLTDCPDWIRRAVTIITEERAFPKASSRSIGEVALVDCSQKSTEEIEGRNVAIRFFGLY